jgi:hypothetical protein
MPLLLLLRGSRQARARYPAGYDFYVDQELGDDSNDGSAASPWQTLSRVHTFSRMVSVGVNLTLSSTAPGEITVTRASGEWSADDVGKSLQMEAGDSANPGGGMILAVNGAEATVNLLVAPATNPVTAGAALVEQPTGVTTKVWVKAATWGGAAVPGGGGTGDENTISPNWNPATPTRLELHFEAGSVMDDEQSDPARSCFYVFGGSRLTFAVYGDESEPLQILNYGGDTEGGTVGGSGQPFGATGAARIEGYNFHISVCGDGISLHNDCSGHFENGHIEKWQKFGIANVDQSYASFENVTLLANGAYPFVANSVPTNPDNRTSFVDCRFLIDEAEVASSAVVACGNLGGGTWSGGQIGQPSRTVNLQSATEDQITDAYLNARSLAAIPATFTRCYGRYSYRQNNNVAVGQTLRNCVFVGGATVETGAGRALFYRNFNPGGDAQRSILDCVISGYLGNAAAGASYAAQDAGYWIASDSELRYCCFHGNTVNIDADLVTANTNDGGTKIANNLTVDPELADAAAIAAGSVSQADYAVTNAALVGAGHAGGNIGFTAGDLVAPD